MLFLYRRTCHWCRRRCRRRILRSFINNFEFCGCAKINGCLALGAVFGRTPRQRLRPRPLPLAGSWANFSILSLAFAFWKRDCCLSLRWWRFGGSGGDGGAATLVVRYCSLMAGKYQASSTTHGQQLIYDSQREYRVQSINAVGLLQRRIQALNPVFDYESNENKAWIWYWFNWSVWL